MAYLFGLLKLPTCCVCINKRHKNLLRYLNSSNLHFFIILKENNQMAIHNVLCLRCIDTALFLFKSMQVDKYTRILACTPFMQKGKHDTLTKMQVSNYLDNFLFIVAVAYQITVR